MRFSEATAILSLSCTLAFSAPACADTLYQQLGGEPKINALATDLVARAHADPRIRDFFDGVSDKKLAGKIAEQFCALSGGPCTYTGRSMRRAHAGLHVSEAAFNALVEDLQDAMDAQHISSAAQNRLLALLAPMARDIIEP